MLFVVREKIGKREAVVRRDEVDARTRAARGIEIGRSLNAARDLADRARFRTQIRPR